MRPMALTWWLAAFLCCLAGGTQAADNGKDRNPLADYLKNLQEPPLPSALPHTLGSLWSDSSGVGQLAADYKASRVNDSVTINVVEQTSAQATGTFNGQRALTASSGISGLVGDLKTKGVMQLFSPSSSYQLTGQGSAVSNNNVQTTLSGKIVAILPSGSMVVEAQRTILANSERQSIVLRGVVRPGDIGPDNSVLSSQLSNLQLEMHGKGVVTDSVRQPNIILRTLLRLLNF